MFLTIPGSIIDVSFLSTAPLCGYRGPVAVVQVAETQMIVVLFSEGSPGASSVGSSIMIAEICLGGKFQASLNSSNKQQHLSSTKVENHTNLGDSSSYFNLDNARRRRIMVI